jgi:hypothetical protein
VLWPDPSAAPQDDRKTGQFELIRAEMYEKFDLNLKKQNQSQPSAGNPKH